MTKLLFASERPASPDPSESADQPEYEQKGRNYREIRQNRVVLGVSVYAIVIPFSIISTRYRDVEHAVKTNLIFFALPSSELDKSIQAFPFNNIQ